VRVLPKLQDLVKIVIQPQDLDLSADASQVYTILAQLAKVSKLLGLVEILHLEQLLNHFETNLIELITPVVHVKPLLQVDAYLVTL
jgi:hypothetical protein